MPNEPVIMARATGERPKRASVLAMLASGLEAVVLRVRALEARPLARDGRDGRDGAVGAMGLQGPAGESIVGPEGPPGRDGKDGVGIKAAALPSDGRLCLLLTDGREIDLGYIRGAQGERGEPGKDGADGDNGVGVVRAILAENGDLAFEYSDGYTVAVGNVRGPQGERGDPGRDGKDGEPARPGAMGPEGPRGRDGVSVVESLVVDGCLVLGLSDGRKINAGPVKGERGDPGRDGRDGQSIPGPAGRSITSSRINEDGHLLLTYTDGTTEDAGLAAIKGDQGESVKGDPGADGVGVAGVALKAGALEITLSDGRAFNLGRVAGRDGKDGADGKPGSEGPQGPAGRDAMPIEFGPASDAGLSARTLNRVAVREMVVDGAVVRVLTLD